MNYEKKTKRKIALMIFMTLIGMVALAAGLYLKLNAGNDAFAPMYLMGTGCGLAFASAVLAIKKIILLKDSNRLKLQKIEDEDERNQLLSYKSSHYSLLFTLLGMYIASFYYAFNNEAVLHVLITIICVLFVSRGILYIIIRKS